MNFPSTQIPRLVPVVLLVFVLSACTGESGVPGDMQWDEATCERCRMVLSDRLSSAQIRYQPPGEKRSRMAAFDDFGCAVVWLEESPWKDDVKTEIWVTDHRTGQWIDARQAVYLPGQVTPMVYGLGAQLDWQEGGLSFEQAYQYVLNVERRLTSRGSQLLERYREQADRREAHRRQHREDAELPSISPVTD